MKSEKEKKRHTVRVFSLASLNKLKFLNNLTNPRKSDALRFHLQLLIKWRERVFRDKFDCPVFSRRSYTDSWKVSKTQDGWRTVTRKSIRTLVKINTRARCFSPTPQKIEQSMQVFLLFSSTCIFNAWYLPKLEQKTQNRSKITE